jgi:chemotaxis protein MotC
MAPPLRLLLALPLLAIAAASAHGQDSAREPAELVRSLRALQDQVVYGNAGAHAAQKALLGEIADRLAQAGPEVWQQPRNARAAVAFVLSGGDPRILKKLLGLGALPGMDDNLVRGALAYAEGRSAEAARLLARVDARTLSPGFAGHIALIQSELIAGKDPAKALALLDEARLLAPGTLIEEAALRRQVSAVAAAGDSDRFEMLAANYLRRFPKSVYAGSFRRQFAADIAGRGDAGGPDRAARLEATLAALDPADRADVQLTIAREALLKGKVELARIAATSALRFLEQAGPERLRAQLYEAAALVVTADFDKAVASVESMETARLGGEEAELLAAVLAVAAEVRRSPPLGGAPGEAATEDIAATFKVAGAAREAIARIDQLFGEASE